MRPKQKFLHGQRVRIARKLDESMAHFPSGCEAIVDYTYAERYGMHGAYPHKEYSLYLLSRGGKITDRVSWYQEEQLSLVSKSVKAGEKLIQAFTYK